MRWHVDKTGHDFHKILLTSYKPILWKLDHKFFLHGSKLSTDIMTHKQQKNQLGPEIAEAHD